LHETDCVCFCRGPLSSPASPITHPPDEISATHGDIYAGQRECCELVLVTALAGCTHAAVERLQAFARGVLVRQRQVRHANRYVVANGLDMKRMNLANEMCTPHCGN
jgi:hypothetical protein